LRRASPLQYNHSSRPIAAAGKSGAVRERCPMAARAKSSVLRRILVQTDCAFWCIHDHLDVLAYLALPTLVSLLAGALGLVWMWRPWELPIAANLLIVGLLVPFLALVIFTALPLPCVVFAWQAAGGRVATAKECFSLCHR